MHDSVLFELCEQCPKSTEELGRVIRPGTKLWRTRAHELLDVILGGLEDDRPLPVLPYNKGDGAPSNFSFDSIQGALKLWRTEYLEQGVPGVRLLNNSQMRSVARHEPQDLEAFNQLEGIRNWQKMRYADELVAVVNENYKTPKKKNKRT